MFARGWLKGLHRHAWAFGRCCGVVRWLAECVCVSVETRRTEFRIHSGPAALLCLVLDYGWVSSAA